MKSSSRNVFKSQWLLLAAVVLGLLPWGEQFWTRVVQYTPGAIWSVAVKNALDLIQSFTQPLVLILGLAIWIVARRPAPIVVAASLYVLGLILRSIGTGAIDVFYYASYAEWRWDFLAGHFDSAFLGNTSAYGPLKFLVFLLVLASMVASVLEIQRNRRTKLKPI